MFSSCVVLECGAIMSQAQEGDRRLARQGVEALISKLSDF